jgi:hypothetical protein
VPESWLASQTTTVDRSEKAVYSTGSSVSPWPPAALCGAEAQDLCCATERILLID